MRFAAVGEKHHEEDQLEERFHVCDFMGVKVEGGPRVGNTADVVFMRVSGGLVDRWTGRQVGRPRRSKRIGSKE